MAARKNKIRQSEQTRMKIQAALLINRMQDCASGEIQMDAQQVSCAKALLNKVLPDLKAIEHTGNADKPVVIRKASEMGDDELATIASGGS